MPLTYTSFAYMYLHFLPPQLEAKPIKQNELYLCTVEVEVSKIKMESQKEYEDKGCPKGIF